MNVVLYTRDMEPITVIDLPMWALEAAERRDMIRLAVMDPIPFASLSVLDPLPSATLTTVGLQFHRMRLPGGRNSWLVTVDNDEVALKLKPAWLPGQRARINEYEKTTRQLASMLLGVLSQDRDS